jgi:amidase
MGMSVREARLPSLFDELPATREVVNDYERSRAMAHEWNTHRSAVSDGLAKIICNGLLISQGQYIDARRHLEQCRRRLDPIFDHHDVLLAPTVPGEAPQGLSWTGDHRLQSIWTQLRTPTVNLPTHTGPNGMPVGIQLIAAPYRDSHLLTIARLIFDALGAGPVVNTELAALSDAG